MADLKGLRQGMLAHARGKEWAKLGSVACRTCGAHVVDWLMRWLTARHLGKQQQQQQASHR